MQEKVDDRDYTLHAQQDMETSCRAGEATVTSGELTNAEVAA